MVVTSQRVDSDDLSIGDVFKDFYVVPDYQREYVWGREEVEQLLVDIETEYSSDGETPSEYFIGSIVVTPNDQGTLDLIDGQQRITTLFILLCAIRDRLAELNEEASQTLEKMISDSDIDEAGRDVFRYRVDLQYEDATDVLRRVASNEVVEPEEDATRSVENIVDALTFCRTFLTAEFGDSAEELRRFFSYLRSRVKLIRVETKSVAHALKVFETINDRGVGLDSMDLLKNLMFMSADRAQFEELKREWKELIDTLHGNEKPLRFLRYFIFATYNVDRLKEDEIYDWFVKNSGLCGFDDDPVAFVRQLRDAARAYANFVNGRDVRGQESRYLQNLRRLSGAARQHLILLLAGVSQSPERFLVLTRELENLFFAFIVTRENTRDFERRFAQWAPELRELGDSDEEFERFTSERLVGARASLKQRFELAMSELEQGSMQQYRIRYILAKLTQYVDEAAWGATQHADLDTYIQSKVEIEHILPRGPSPAVLESFDDGENYPKHVGRLGNLTLLEKSINSSVGNGMFSEKQAAYQQSSFLLTRTLGGAVKVGENTSVDRAVAQLEKFETWTSGDIDRRQTMLANLAAKVWDVGEGSGGER